MARTLQKPVPSQHYGNGIKVRLSSSAQVSTLERCLSVCCITSRCDSSPLGLGIAGARFGMGVLIEKGSSGGVR